MYGYGIVDVMAAIETSFVGDLDEDGDIDLDDFGIFNDCYSGPGDPPDPGCEPADLNQNDHVDLPDFAVFQRTFTGPWEG